MLANYLAYSSSRLSWSSSLPHHRATLPTQPASTAAEHERRGGPFVPPPRKALGVGGSGGAGQVGTRPAWVCPGQRPRGSSPTSTAHWLRAAASGV